MKFPFDKLEQLTSPGGGEFNVRDIDSAFAFCKKVATSHYENFPVGSLLIPANLRPAVFAVYTFARIADDIADEHEEVDKEKRKAMLDNMIQLLDNHEGNPVFLALNTVIDNYNIPKELFYKLLIAFKWDIEFQQASNWEELLNYCDHSANPIGEILLYLFNSRTEENKVMSDHICTGLQLINFWQDLSVDIRKNRYYIPGEVFKKFDIKKENLLKEKNSAKLLYCLNYIYDFTEDYYLKGKRLPLHLSSLRFKFEILMTIEGGKKILKKTRRLYANILDERPVLNKKDIFLIFINAIKSIKIF